MYFGTDAGAGFDAPAREVEADGGTDDADTSATAAAEAIVDAGGQADGGAGRD